MLVLSGSNRIGGFSVVIREEGGLEQVESEIANVMREHHVDRAYLTDTEQKLVREARIGIVEVDGPLRLVIG